MAVGAAKVLPEAEENRLPEETKVVAAAVAKALPEAEENRLLEETRESGDVVAETKQAEEQNPAVVSPGGRALVEVVDSLEGEPQAG